MSWQRIIFLSALAIGMGLLGAGVGHYWQSAMPFIFLAGVGIGALGNLWAMARWEMPWI